MLAVEEGRESRYLVENVIWIGAPIESLTREASEDLYDMKRHVVTGRFINVYSTKDEILEQLKVFSSIKKVAGMDGIFDVPGVTNLDAGELVQSHFMYPAVIPTILKLIFTEWL